MEGVLSSLQPAVEAVGAALTALVTTRVPLPIVSSLVGAHLPEFEKKELSSAITTAFNIPGDEPSFALFFVVHASFLTLWFAGTRERVDSRTPGRTAFGSWFQSLLGFIMMNMTGNCIAAILTGRPPMMVLHPELLSSYAMPYALISSLALVGLDLPKIAMGNPTIAKFVSIVIMVLNGVAQTMVISSNVDLTLSDATLSATAGRSIPGQFILAFLAAVGGALALDGLGIQKAEWKFALPPGLQEIGGPAGVVFRTLAGATALYMSMVNPRIGSILRILFQLPPSWKNAPLVTPALARPILFCFIVGNYLFFNLVVPMLSSGGKKKNYVKPAPPPTPKMERVERGNTATPAKKR